MNKSYKPQKGTTSSASLIDMHQTQHSISEFDPELENVLLGRPGVKSIAVPRDNCLEYAVQLFMNLKRLSPHLRELHQPGSSFSFRNTSEKKRREGLLVVPALFRKDQYGDDMGDEHPRSVTQGVSDQHYDFDAFTSYFRDSQLRIQFEGDDGVGTGPTMEFFTITANELSRCDFQLWLDNDTHNTSHREDMLAIIDDVVTKSNRSHGPKKSQSGRKSRFDVGPDSADKAKEINNDYELVVFGLLRCEECTLLQECLTCPTHPTQLLTMYTCVNDQKDKVRPYVYLC
ncbi:hypothetical protein RFI_23920 [Reticulomyxa filosa]|uniref:HECT domain-containing protein n=1 Tax=Reticulomyxa filosa TaxID=46433 RepID=X6MHI2_RETFI|nr:hypothetical protein RFI_23920 [Reticulomyxa filosa]|eukprot:ETO13458.1 hypothetical protein RFI_23920 [Reticulomyxa filosa]